MVEQSGNSFEERKQEILNLFYADEPLQAMDKLQSLIEDA